MTGVARRWIGIACLTAPFAVGCFNPNAVPCGNGLICPAGKFCDDKLPRCLTSAQVRACEGRDEGADCALYENAPAACRSGACEVLFCGDGIVSGSEACDGAPPAEQSCLTNGFDQGFLGCSSTCEPAFEGCRSFSLQWTVWPTPTMLPTPATGQWTGVWASGENDVHVVGGDGIFHWDGTVWSTTLPHGEFWDLWGGGPNDVFASGPDGLAHWDGSRWSAMTDSGLTGVSWNGVWGSGGDDVFAVGVDVDNRSAMSHWNGTSWSRVTVPNAFGGLSSVWGSGPNDVFALGLGMIMHWDGSSSSIAFSSDSTIGFNGVSGSGPDDVFAVGWEGFAGGTAHWDGTIWSLAPSIPEPLSDVWVGGPGVAFAAGSRGTMFKWGGRSWVPTPVVDANNRPFGTNTQLRFSGTAGGVFAVGTADNGVDPLLLHWAASGWSPAISFGPLSGVWASGPDDAYAVGSGTIKHWDGAGWALVVVPPGVPITSVWGSGPNDVFVVGTGVGVLHWDGAAWFQSTSVVPDLVSVWGSGTDDVFAVGSLPPTVVHWDGNVWSKLFSETGRGFSGVWASGPDDAFVVGLSGIWHWDGARLSPMIAPEHSTLQGVWGSGPDDVFAVGYGGEIVHWDGAQWSAMSSGTTRALYTVAGSGAGDVFAGGDDVLLHLRGGIWEPISHPGVTQIRGLSVTPGRVFVVGAEGEIHLDRALVTCVGRERDCNDGWDNDCDGLQDGADSDCAGRVAEQCANLVDDDGDGMTDCDDPDCANLLACKVPGGA